MDSTKRAYPKRLTDGEMAKVGVEIIDRNRKRLRCMNCGHIWWPCLVPGGRLPKRYWRCENGCNSPGR
jgi:hypothetical protein